MRAAAAVDYAEPGGWDIALGVVFSKVRSGNREKSEDNDAKKPYGDKIDYTSPPPADRESAATRIWLLGKHDACAA